MGHDIFDLVVVVTLALFTLRGISNGFIGEIAGIFALLGGFWAARAWNAALSPQLAFISDPGLRPMAACVIIFFAVMLVIGVIARILKKLASFSFVAWADRLCGAILGLIKGIFVWTLIFIVLEKVVPDAQFLRDSRSYPYFNDIIAQIRQWLPPELAARI